MADAATSPSATSLLSPEAMGSFDAEGNYTPLRSVAWWAEQTKGFNFSGEDRIPAAQFNKVIWQGIMGDKPYPTLRNGQIMRQVTEPSALPASVSSSN